MPFILTRPQLGENIGAAARVMTNFAMTDLRIVAPRDGWPNPAADSMAAGGKALLDAATHYDTAANAVADCQQVVALTARPRDITLPVFSPKEWMRQQTNVKTAYLFGPERTGLENEEIALCDAIITVPVSEAYPSLNLAQSVAIMAYELNECQPQEASHMPASRKQLQGAFDQLEAALDEANFWSVPEKKPTMWRNIRAMLTRAEFTEQEVNTLRGMLKALGR